MSPNVQYVREAIVARGIDPPHTTQPEQESVSSTDIPELMEEFGPPAYRNTKGQPSQLNESFWAALRAKETVMLYEPLEARFYYYNSSDGLYHVLSDKKLCCELAATIFEASHSWGETWALLQRFRGARHITGVIAHLKGQVEKRDAFTERNSHIIHCANVVLEFSSDGTVQKRPFSPADYSRNASPISYHPAALCPQFQSMLLGHLRTDDVAVLQKLAGQALLGHNLTQRFAILDGPGGASKSAFVSVIRKIVGEHNCAELRTKVLDQRFEAARLAGRSLLCGADVNANFLNEPGASRIKAYTGGDLLDVEFKGSNERGTTEGHFNVFITCNSQLCVRLQGDESSWCRRMVVVRYETAFTGRKIVDIDDMLVRQEGAGILNWCIDGAKKLFADIAQHGDLFLSPRQQKIVDDLLSQSDSLRQFLKDKVTKTTHSSDLSSEELFQAYSAFTQARGWDALPLSTFERRLPDLMAQFFGAIKGKVSRNIRGYTRDVRGYKNVKLRTDNNK